MSVVVVVESPAKAKTIGKYLGPGYHVVASYGHIRDLPPKDGSVRPDDDFAMDWEVDDRSEKHIRDIAGALRGADRLYLATDPDREGEAISWHVRQELENRKALKGVEVKRVTFNEITKDAVRYAIAHPRELDHELIQAYLARRALDYLVGFTLSPVLWRKLPGSRSAGRVQSVALRLICEREAEIERFVSQEFWTVDADLLAPDATPFVAHLTHLDGRKLDKFDLPDAAAAGTARDRVAAAALSVLAIERKKAKRHPSPPFTTSTLQQEASRKLHFTAKHTMQVAQRLYEGVEVDGETVGLITYMRTDGVQMANEAIQSVRALIKGDFGDRYLPSAPRHYKAKAKNAQEAHEAIRPTDVGRAPAALSRFLDRDQLRLYELIWKRTMASQMESAEFDQVAVDIAPKDRSLTLRANGSVVVFDGFLRLYREDRDDAEGDENDRLLPPMKEGDVLKLTGARSDQHFTQPPPRYSEASLVKRLEELGIGRPSTYASILGVLQDRSYVRLDSRRFFPEDRGRLVTAFLESFFNRYVQYGFTADLEERLDDISGGRVDWKMVLRDFWTDFHTAVDGTKDLRVSQVLDALDQDLGPHFFPDDGSGLDPRKCPTCANGRLGLKLGKFGAFIGCSNYPDCRHTRPLTTDGSAPSDASNTRDLGSDPETGTLVSVRKGPYGFYVQRDPVAAAEEAPPPEEKPPESKAKGRKKVAKPKPPAPKRVSLPKGLEPQDLDLEKALALLALPREIGVHPDSRLPILAGIGRFGPYLKHGDAYKSLPDGDDVLTVGLNRAVDLLSQGGKARTPARLVGNHPADGKPVTVRDGRYGPYAQHGDLRATLPKDREAGELTLDEAVALLAAKAAKGGAPAKTTKSGIPAKTTKTVKAKPTKAAKSPAKGRTAAKTAR